MSIQIERHHFTVSEYYRMAEAGIITEASRVELIAGEIIEMSPIGSYHAACVSRLNRLFSSLIHQNIIVRVQDPVHLDDYSEPQPDLALLKARDDFYASQHPEPADVLLLVEVADTSLGYDQEIKLPIYAKAGIAEVWLIDLQNKGVKRYTRPHKSAYQDEHTFKHGETIHALTVQQLTVKVNDILG